MLWAILATISTRLFFPFMLPLLVEKFRLTFPMDRILAPVLSFSSSMTQPLSGHLADALGIEWAMRFLLLLPVGSLFFLHSFQEFRIKE